MTVMADTREPIRLLFELSPEDNPRLYADLMRFNKGTKRVNRLRFLAYEGLLAQGWALVPGSSAAGRDRTPSGGAPAMRLDTVAARHVIQAFEAPTVGDGS